MFFLFRSMVIIPLNTEMLASSEFSLQKVPKPYLRRFSFKISICLVLSISSTTHLLSPFNPSKENMYGRSDATLPR